MLFTRGELKRYNFEARATHPKFRPLDETLRSHIAGGEKQIGRSSELADQYPAQSSKLGGAKLQP
jgi:hypothetical protein